MVHGYQRFGRSQLQALSFSSTSRRIGSWIDRLESAARSVWIEFARLRQVASSPYWFSSRHSALVSPRPSDAVGFVTVALEAPNVWNLSTNLGFIRVHRTCSRPAVRMMYCLGWIWSLDRGQDVFSHQGSLTGFGAHMLFRSRQQSVRVMAGRLRVIPGASKAGQLP